MLTFRELETRFLLLKPKIIQAGIRVKAMRDRNEVVVEKKSDGSYVTNADKWANEFIVGFIKNELNEVAIGEESIHKNYEAGIDTVWFVDPIDGTSAYVQGGKDYFVLAGLAVDGKPVLGIHYQPETGKLIYGWQGKYPHIQLPGKKPEPVGITANWNNENRLYIKTPNHDIRQRILNLGVKKAVYARGMVDMIAPLFQKAEGYLSYRRSYFWDIVAPAAIMRSAGFTTYSPTIGELFNTGDIQSPFFYSLPPDTPPEFIEKIQSIHESRSPLL